ncbi:hypothetical protein B0A55_12934 [Friedmanniomyces simplex]|uniref:Uncharacterized protein n=1 Tax=Friedmanniomyces simplex TaxID=329884 RepID=A0A4U0VZY2_9PEZI|nr:hypothetical protein B0A55_12934 [Friedmanniomyces simplex]
MNRPVTGQENPATMAAVPAAQLSAQARVETARRMQVYAANRACTLTGPAVSGAQQLPRAQVEDARERIEALIDRGHRRAIESLFANARQSVEARVRASRAMPPAAAAPGSNVAAGPVSGAQHAPRAGVEGPGTWDSATDTSENGDAPTVGPKRVPRKLVAVTPNRRGKGTNGAIDTFLLHRRPGPEPLLTAQQRWVYESQQATDARVTTWRRREGIVWPEVARHTEFQVDPVEDAWQALLAEEEEEDQERIEGYLFFTHKPQRPPPLALSPRDADLPPSLALFPDVELQQYLRDHDKEVATLKACIDAHKVDTKATAHAALNAEYSLLETKRQSASYGTLGLYRKLLVLRQEQALERRTYGDFTLLAITSITASGFPDSQQEYGLPPGASWLRMQTVLNYMTQCWRACGADGAAMIGNHACQDPKWMYQLGGDAQKKAVWSLVTEEDYAGLRERVRVEKTLSAVMWPECLWEASKRARAKTEEKIRTGGVQDEEADENDWTGWEPFDGTCGGGDGYAKFTDADLEKTEMETERLSGGKPLASNDDASMRVPTKKKPQGRQEIG